MELDGTEEERISDTIRTMSRERMDQALCQPLLLK